MQNRMLMPVKAFVALTIYIIIGILFPTLDLLTSYEGITITSLILVVCVLIVLRQTTGEIFSFSVLFVAFSYIMHLGHPLLLSLGYDRVFGFDQRGYTTTDIYLKACQYCVITLFFLGLGIILGSLRIFRLKKEAVTNTLDTECDEEYLKKTYIVGLNLFFITLIPRVYVDLSKVILYLQGGYLKTYSLNVNGYISVLAKMLDLAVLVIMVGSKNNRHRARIWLIGMCIYHCLFMLTGNRGDAVMRIMVMLLVYFKLFPVKHVSPKQAVLLFGVVWIGGAVMNALGSLRLEGMTIETFLNEVLKSLINEPIIFKIFAEFGVTIKTVCYALETFPQMHPFSYGINYVKGTFAFLPNIGGFITNSIKELVFVYYFQNSSVIGGSFVGELYYAFGQLGCIMAVFIGFFVSWIDCMRIRAQNNHDWKKFLISIVFVAPCIWWIRDYYYTCVREIVMSIFALYLFYKVQIVIRKNN